MEHSCNTPDDIGDADLDPRIQIELEKLNSATDEINKLEIELDEANKTFHLLLNESTRRLKLQSKKLGSCIERARPYYDALEVAKQAQFECQRAAVQFQRANEIHQAAKETVALAEQRFMSKQHEWQFDNAWQEMLNHATIKVTEAENQKAESGREHQKRATFFNSGEQKVQVLEQRLRSSINKSRPYFEEKCLCQGQLSAQKQRVEQLQGAVVRAKASYAASLRALETISEEIHYKRGNAPPPRGPRLPGVGAELLEQPLSYQGELDGCDRASLASTQDEGVEELKVRLREVASRPLEGGEGQSSDRLWETELNATVSKLEHAMLLRESCRERPDDAKPEQQGNHDPERDNGGDGAMEIPENADGTCQTTAAEQPKAGAEGVDAGGQCGTGLKSGDPRADRGAEGETCWDRSRARHMTSQEGLS